MSDDHSAYMKARHEATEHDAWFRTEVETSIIEADDPNAKWVSHERVMEDLDACIARLAAHRS